MILKIALAGGIGSGKSKIASFLSERYNGKILSFAAQVKLDVIQYRLTIDGKIDKVRDRAIIQDYAQLRQCLLGSADHNNYNLTRTFPSPDFLFKGMYGPDGGYELQDLGPCYPNYWVIQAEKEMKPLLEKGVSVIFDDLRFPHEAKMLRHHGFTLIRVLTDPEVRQKRLLARDGKYDSTRFGDISESYFDKLEYDFILDNNGTFEETIGLLESKLS